MKFFGLAIMAAAICASAPVSAQQSSSTQEAVVVPRFADGVLQGCAINFQVLERDTMYAAGQPVFVDGSFQVYNFGNGRLNALLKLGLRDISSGAFVAPSKAYIVNGFSTSVDEQINQMPSETPGFTLFGFSIGDQITASIANITVNGKFTFAYQREGGSGGVPIEIDISQTPEKVAAWTDCLDALLNLEP